MSDTVGHITVPEIAVSGTFPTVPEYLHGRESHPGVAIRQRLSESMLKAMLMAPIRDFLSWLPA